jgi:hypothetical protein
LIAASVLVVAELEDFVPDGGLGFANLHPQPEGEHGSQRREKSGLHFQDRLDPDWLPAL